MEQTPITFKNLAQIEELLFLAENLIEIKEENEKLNLAHDLINSAWRIVREEKKKLPNR